MIPTATGWGTFSAVLFHPNCSLEFLSLPHTSICDEGISFLGEALAVNKSLKYLDLACSYFISITGWREFSKCLNYPDSALEVLDLGGCRINDEVASLIVSALEGNTCLKELNLTYTHQLADKFWDDLARVLYDRTTIASTYSSNHTLHTLTMDFWFGDDDVKNDILSSLKMNETANKEEVALQKILDHHYFEENSCIEEFTCIPDTILPFAIEWIDRKRLGLEKMYDVVRRVPTQFYIRNRPYAAESKKRKWGWMDWFMHQGKHRRL